MYRIQAHNKRIKHIEIFKVKTADYDEFMSKLRANPDYGLIEIEYLARS